jgi:hypothetical protein
LVFVQVIGVIERELLVGFDISGRKEGYEMKALVDVIYEARDDQQIWVTRVIEKSGHRTESERIDGVVGFGTRF